MNDIDYPYIRRTIDRFLTGETSLKEERTLYDFFKRTDLPDDLAPYKGMFQWYASLAESGQQDREPTVEKTEKAAEPGKVRLLPLSAWHWLGAAAAIVLLFTIGFVLRSPSAQVPEEYLAYEGSYIIRDGKKITDLNVVVPEIMKAEQMVSKRLDDFDARLEAADEAFDRSITSAYDLSNPAVREIVEASLKY